MHRTLHLAQCKKERLDYHKRRELAIQMPGTKDSLIIDYAAPFAIPFLSKMPKSWLCKRRIKVSICGTINHGQPIKSIYYHLPTFPQGPNLLCTFLYHQIAQSRSNNQNQGKDILYLQGDNAYKDVKNTIVFGFLALLVQKRFYNTIILSFLHPGHTHEDVDSLFGTLKTARMHNNIGDLHQFATEFLPQALQRHPCAVQSVFVNAVCDWTNFLSPHLRPIAGHSRMRQFLFTRREEDGYPHMFYRNEPEGGAWVGHLASSQCGIQLLRSIPEGTPTPIEGEDLPQEIFKDIPHFLNMLTPSSNSWWRNIQEDQTIYQNLQLTTNNGLTLWNADDYWLSETLDISCEDCESREVELADVITSVNHPVFHTSSFKKGDTIAVNIRENDSIPYSVCRIKSVSETRLDVKWLECKPSGKWVTTNNADNININIVWGFVSLTKGQKIKKSDHNKILTMITEFM